MRVIVTPLGPAQDVIDAAKLSTSSRPEVQRLLKGTKNRLLHFELIESDSSNAAQNPPSRFLATFYDYTNNRTVTAEGSFAAAGAVKLSTSNEQMAPSEEEFQAAVKILEGDQIFGSALRAGELKTYAPMPPVLYPNKSGDRVERTIYIGVRPSSSSGFIHEIVGVNMIRETVTRYKKGAPPTSRATPDVCAIPNSGQATTANGTAGQYQFTVLDTGGAELWSFLAIRPSASSGNSSERSGIELRDVKYRGKSVLKRIHTPILNVNYDSGCGPFRDWQYQEGMFQATGTDVPGTNGGVRDCGTNIATTALESGDDTGNFKGIAFYRETNPAQLVLVSEMNAGWYRYIAEYGFGDDGTIRPRYGYGATDNSCVCLDHYHHVYWRMDFDIGVGGNSITLGSASGRSLATEAKMFRFASARQLNFLVSNPATGDAYMIRPNSNDGTANAYGMGDIWLLRFKGTSATPTEIDDPNGGSTQANIDAWLNGESIANQDIVIWYAGHFDHTHDSDFSERLFNAPLHLKGDHVHGPDLVPVQW